MKYNSGDTVTFKSINSKIPAIDLYSKIYSGQGLQVGRGLGATLEDAKFVNSNKNQQILYGLLDTIQGTSRIAGGATSLTAGAYMIPSGFGISYSGTLIAHGSSNLLFGANDTYRGISNIILGLKESSLGYNELAYIEATKERTQSYEFKKTALDKLEEKSSIIQGINLISLESTQYINEFIKLHFSKPKPTFINNNTLDNTDKEISIKPEVTISSKKDKNSKPNLVNETNREIHSINKETITYKRDIISKEDKKRIPEMEKYIRDEINENGKVNLSKLDLKSPKDLLLINPFSDDNYSEDRIDINGKKFKNPKIEAGVLKGMVLDVETGDIYKLSDFKENVSSDHIFPQSAIKNIAGFKKLSKANQERILKYEGNIMYLTNSQNSSKGNKSVVKLGDNNQYDGFIKYKGNLIDEKAKEIIDFFQKENINKLKKLIE